MQEDDLQAQYLKSLEDRIETIKTLVRDYRSGDAEIDKKIRTLAHSLHGSGATFGYPEISEAAKQVEYAPDKELIRRLTQLVKVLKDAPNKPAPVAAVGDFEVLLIDDDADNARLIADALKRKPGSYKLTVAETAAGGEKLLTERKFDLILLDLVLPDRDGREILHQLKLELKLATPVFVLSAIERDVVRVECMSLGAEKFFLKPFDPDAVALGIEKLLNKGAAVGGNRELSLVPLGGEPARAAPPPPPTQGVNSAAKGAKTVLVVEDDTMQAANIRQKLQREGLNVEHVVDGLQAVAALQNKPYDLTILDVRMPGLDGFEVLRRARNDMQLTDMPVIMVTAMGSEADIIKGYDLGADDYLLKPFSSIQLVARVKTLLKAR
jgi:DNA-binding response OmpR family regulator